VEHQASPGDRQLPRPPSPQRSARPWPAHAHERAHAEGSAQDGRGEEEGGVEDLMAKDRTEIAKDRPAKDDKNAPKGEAPKGAGAPRGAPAKAAAAPAADAAGEAKAAPRKKRERRLVPRGTAHVKASFNNTIVSIADPAGNVIAWSSAGAAGWKGSRKSTPYAAQVAAENAARKAMDAGMK